MKTLKLIWKGACTEKCDSAKLHLMISLLHLCKKDIPETEGRMSVSALLCNTVQGTTEHSYRTAFLHSRSFHDSIIDFILSCRLCNIACTLETIASAEQLLFEDCSLLCRQSCPAYCHQQCVSRWTKLKGKEKQNDNREIRRRHYANRRSKS